MKGKTNYRISQINLKVPIQYYDEREQKGYSYVGITMETSFPHPKKHIAGIAVNEVGSRTLLSAGAEEKAY
jgi:hypothetical protein